MAVALSPGRSRWPACSASNVETPISAVSVLVIFGWVALVSRMRQCTGTIRRQVTRFRQVLARPSWRPARREQAG